MLKIGLNARFLVHPFTGIGQYTRHLITAMAEVAPQNEYFLFTPELVDFPFPENCHQIRLAEKKFSSNSLKKAHWEQILLPAEMEKFKLNMVHYLYPSNPRKKLPWPTVVTIHDAIPWVLKSYQKRWRSKAYYLNAKLALKKIDHFITVSDFSKQEIINYLKLKESKINVIPLASAPDQKELKLPDLTLRRPYFLYVGGYDERKNVPLLIDAYQKHIAPYYKIDLILVGGKNRGLDFMVNNRYSEKVANKYCLKIKGRVVFTGSLGESELKGLYDQAIALVHPSLYEGFNLPLIEAMSVGTPVIASDIPIHHEVTGERALFFNPDHIDSAGLAMHQFIHDKSLQKHLKIEGINHAKQFSWQKTAEETLYVYDLYT